MTPMVNTPSGGVRPVQTVVPPLAPAPVASPLNTAGNSTVGVGMGTPVCLPANNLPFGSYPWCYSYSSSPYWSMGYWDPCWSPCSWVASPAWCTPSWCFGAPGWSWVSWCRPSWRYSVGFGYSSTSYWDPCATPSYITYGYYPWSYYNTVGYYPGYSTLYHRGAVVEYLETVDPYVEYDTVVVDSGMVTVPARMSLVPSAFNIPLDPDFPAGLSAGECLARGEGWLRSRRYLLAAEAFRRAWLFHEDDGWAASQLGLALAASGRWQLSAMALAKAVELEGALIERAPELITAFESEETFQRDVLASAQRQALRTPEDNDAAFVLSCAQLCVGDAWGARTGLLKLKEVQYPCSGTQRMIDNCELKISGAPLR
ncbi:MAG: hypothetical protein EXS14_02610 [Planctomycetes bacterium]|nr:hypothetical protein [Planctomycetota bacterium]